MSEAEPRSTDLDGRGGAFLAPRAREAHGTREVGPAVAVEEAVAALVIRPALEVDLLARASEHVPDLGGREVGVGADDEGANSGHGSASGGGEAEADRIEGFPIEERAGRCGGEVGHARANGVARVVAGKDAPERVPPAAVGRVLVVAVAGPYGDDAGMAGVAVESEVVAVVAGGEDDDAPLAAAAAC